MLVTRCAYSVLVAFWQASARSNENVAIGSVLCCAVTLALEESKGPLWSLPNWPGLSADQRGTQAARAKKVNRVDLLQEKKSFAWAETVLASERPWAYSGEWTWTQVEYLGWA